MLIQKRVWLIDDDEDDCFFFKTALGELGQSVEFYSDHDSEAALTKMQSGKDNFPDLLFLDWNMPKFSGKEVLISIRANPQFASIPVIIYSTSRAQADKDIAMQLGASYFLSKPSTIGELHKNLQYIFSFDWTKKNS